MDDTAAKKQQGQASGQIQLPPDDGVKTKRIGDRLVEQGILTKDQLVVALHEKQKTGAMLGEIFVNLGFISPEMLSSLLAESSGYEEFNFKKTMIEPEALACLTKKDALKYQVLPLSLNKETGMAVVAMADPYDVVALDKLRQLLPRGMTIVPRVSTPTAIADAIDSAYGHAVSIDGIMKELGGGQGAKDIDLSTMTEDQAYTHPIVRLVNALVTEAVKMGASDLHFEPEENFIRLRYRIDGEMVSVHTLHREYWNGICQRLKIMSGMNIADKLTPQDGRFGLDIGGREADFRVSALPTVHGENIVLRVLDKSSGIVPLEKLGFSDHNLRLIQKSQARPEGIIIVTGPTGSGKTTSLYSMINAINTVDVNIMTLEDPVEYALPMIRQANVKEGMGFSFGEGVKALLRQDPDIIFVGEVRDEVTAQQALKAAMTGHQVFTTLHTNDCFGAIPRLVDLGLKPGMLAGAIIASFAQRLVRRLCPQCKQAKPATAEECRLLGIDAKNPPMLHHAVGCPACNNSGFKGRIACAEILYLDEDLNDLIAEGAHRSKIKAMAREKGFRSMLDDGIEKVLQGTTSLDALMKILNFSDRL